MTHLSHYENAQTQGINYVLIPNYGLLCNHANSYTDSKKTALIFFLILHYSR